MKVICEVCGKLKAKARRTRDICDSCARPKGNCSKCGKHKNIKAGLCLSCHVAKNTESLPERKCGNCGKLDKKIRHGLCKVCYKKNWNQDNSDKINKYNMEWNHSHLERRKTTVLKYDRSPRGKVVNLMNRHKRIARLAKAGGDGLSRTQWKKIKEDQNNKCYYCGKHPKRFEIEHVVPISKGGIHDITNIVAACKSCNRRKGTMSLEDFQKKLEEEGN